MLGIKLNSPTEKRLRAKDREPAGLGMLPEPLFLQLLCLERKRTERSGRHFVLMLLEPGNLLKDPKTRAVERLLSAITLSTRDTDLKGWYKENSIIGAIFTEVGGPNLPLTVQAISTKVEHSLRDKLSAREIDQIRLTFHVFPENWDGDGSGSAVASTLQKELARGANRPLASLTAKRLVDIAGSILALILFLPFLVVIAAAIRLTSKGPVLFRQVRLGQYGRKFTLLKFRSMYQDSDPALHREFVHRFIEGTAGAEQDAGGEKLYKLTKDPRITSIGGILRRTSLDELPQFLNVLRGEMSLVGPRPPLVYEVERYDLWHKQRLLAVKPGITGLWQVQGRSRVKFDDMVRLDIRYSRTWSLLLDFKILLQTPRAVFSGSGAR
jgi:lipopolysaccharide/colanic/teichoic acid biosynthesis glycosyltransferase